MPVTPYLTVVIRHDPIHWTSPPYRKFKAWAVDEGIPEETGHFLSVWAATDETPIYAVLDVYDLDENGNKIPDGEGGYTTHPVTYSPLTQLPPTSGTIVGGAR
ncbi:hypothetical protein [Streptosporangium roseum]|uniref:hypothetical protein n=1 Tax=Streptosporangium roseum TaxID=2001 RepID=UPI003321C221